MNNKVLIFIFNITLFLFLNSFVEKECVFSSDDVNHKDKFSKIKTLENVVVELKEKPLILSIKRKVIYLITESEPQMLFFTELIYPFMKLKKIKASMIDESGAEKEINEKYKFESQIHPISFYSESKFITMVIPNVKKGFRVVFDSEIEQPLEFDSINVMFLRNEPIETLSLEVKIPQLWMAKLIPLNIKDYSIEERALNHILLTAKKISGLQMLPFFYEDCYNPIQIGILFYDRRNLKEKTWQDLSKNLYEKYSKNLISSKELAEEVDYLTRGLTTLDKIKAICEFVQKKVRYVSIEEANNLYIPKRAYEVYKKLYGDCKDKVGLLITMLRHVGINAYPVLCIFKNRGFVADSFPSVIQFEHSIVAIELADKIEGSEALGIYDGKYMLFFDPSDTETPFGMLSFYLQGTKALVLSDKTKELINLPQSNYNKNLIATYGQLRLDSNGGLKGKIQKYYYGIDKINIIGKYNDLGKENFKQYILNALDILLASIIDFQIDEPADVSSPFNIKYTFAASNFAESLPNKFIVKKLVLFGFEKNPFTEQSRDFPIMFDYPYSNIQNYTISLPIGFELKDAFKEEIKNEYGEYKLEIKMKENTVYVDRRLSIKSDLIQEKDYSNFKEFIEKIVQLENKVIIFSRNTAQSTQ